MSRRSHDSDPSFLFELRIPGQYKGDPDIYIRAWDRPPPEDNRTGHSYLDCELRQGGRVIFKRGDTWCGVNQWTSTDGPEARALCLSLFGDWRVESTDPVTEEQQEWLERNGEYLSMLAAEREERAARRKAS